MPKCILSAFADEAGDSLEEQIAALKRNGISYMEIRAVNKVSICKTPLETVAQYKKQLDEAGIRVLTVGSSVGKMKLSENYTEHLAMYLHTLGAAKILGAERIRMFSFFTDRPEEDEAEVMEKMEELVRIAEAAGIRLYHENEKGIFGASDANVQKLMDRFEGRMDFIFDPANFIQCGVKPLEAYGRLKNRTGYFHIKDALSSDGRVVPAGQGEGNIGDILSDFVKDRENVMLTVEPHLKSFAGIKDSTSIKEGTETIYQDNNESFDVAVAALKSILKERGISYE